MANRIPWRKLADRQFWYPEHGLWYPVCFELAFTAGDDVEPVYVGVTECEQTELNALAAGEPPELVARIRAELDKGRDLLYRALAAPTLGGAEELRTAWLAERDYSWNA